MVKIAKFPLVEHVRFHWAFNNQRLVFTESLAYNFLGWIFTI